MKKMVRRLIRVLVLIVVLLVLAGVVMMFYIDRLAAAALTKGVEYAGGTACEVEEVDVSLLGGSVGVRGLAIKNPAGYPQADMFALASADVAVRIRSLWNQPVQVRTLEIVRPVLRLEVGQGGSNVKVFLDHVNRKLGGDGPAEEPDEKTEQTRMIVDRLLLKDATVQLGSGVGPGGLGSVTLETVELTDLRGRDGKGITPGELAARIVFQLVQRGALKGQFNLGNFVPADFSERLGEAADAAQKLLKQKPEELLKKSPLDLLRKPKPEGPPEE